MITAEFREIYWTKDRAPSLVTINIEGETPDNYYQLIRLNSIPPDGHKWIFQWPSGRFEFVWKSIAVNLWEDIQIQGTIIDCLESAMATFRRNYYTAKDFNATVINSPEDLLKIKAKTVGPQFYAQALQDDTYTTVVHNAILNPPGDPYKLNHQAGILLFRYVQNLNLEGTDTKILLSEHIAPVARTSEIIEDCEILFELQDPLHSLTEFKPADRWQFNIIRADGHTAAVQPAVFQIAGSIPKAERLVYFPDIIALRGGSRFENHNAYDPSHGTPPIDFDFITFYLKVEKKGVLNYSNINDVTLIQEQYRYWFNYFDTMVIKVNLTIVFKPEEESVGVISGPAYNFETNQYDVLIIPCGIQQIPNFGDLIDAASRSLEDVDYYYLTIREFYTDEFKAEIGDFRIIESVFGEKYFFFENSAGGGEVLRFTGEKAYDVEITKSEYNKMLNPWGSPIHKPFQQRTKAQKTVKYSEIYECSTGNLTRDRILYYLDLLISENVWEIIYTDDQGNNLEGYRYQVLIQPGTFRITTDKRDGVHIYNLSFKYRRANDELSIGLFNNHG
jgi:hypothetical protein